MDAKPDGTPEAPSRARALFERLVRDGETFWGTVYEPFMARDITRDDVRAIVRQGLELTRGSYKAMAQLFNLPNVGWHWLRITVPSGTGTVTAKYSAKGV